ncbi:MAG: MoaD/ThiS family protein [Chloroflexota bacterium]|nr:MAG: MoaD/ThiS family protein [Chloroflexota bacterium]
MKVWFSTHLRSYTGGAEIDIDAAPSVEGLLADLERRFPGLRFRIIDEQERIREHISIFVNSEKMTGLAHPLSSTDRVMVIGALSGGSRDAGDHLRAAGVLHDIDSDRE